MEGSEFHPGTERGEPLGTPSFDFCVMVYWGLVVMSTKMQVGRPVAVIRVLQNYLGHVCKCVCGHTDGGKGRSPFSLC